MKTVLAMATEWRGDEGTERREYGEQHGGVRKEEASHSRSKEKAGRQMRMEKVERSKLEQRMWRTE